MNRRDTCSRICDERRPQKSESIECYSPVSPPSPVQQFLAFQSKKQCWKSSVGRPPSLKNRTRKTQHVTQEGEKFVSFSRARQIQFSTQSPVFWTQRPRHEAGTGGRDNMPGVAKAHHGGEVVGGGGGLAPEIPIWSDPIRPDPGRWGGGRGRRRGKC